ncbi:E3 ubiquitin-protein ligase CHFR [Bienertia sinuspersici]
MEIGQSSGSKSSDEVWAKLVPSDSSYASIEISSDDAIVCSQISSTSDKLEWCQIMRSSDRCSATIRNKRTKVILIDGAILESDDVVAVNCGSEIVPAATREGYLSYKFEVMPVQEQHSEKYLKISLDPEHTKCGICLNVWHDVVTVAPCLHNFCNGCFSEWLKRCQEKHSSVLCPHCRAAVHFVGRNHFLHGIEEDILLADASLRRTAEELAVLDSYASIKSSLFALRHLHLD